LHSGKWASLELDEVLGEEKADPRGAGGGEERGGRAPRRQADLPADGQETEGGEGRSRGAGGADVRADHASERHQLRPRLQAERHSVQYLRCSV
jgi:hypothetical protein